MLARWLSVSLHVEGRVFETSPRLLLLKKAVKRSAICHGSSIGDAPLVELDARVTVGAFTLIIFASQRFSVHSAPRITRGAKWTENPWLVKMHTNPTGN